jgi:hypothetical protein
VGGLMISRIWHGRTSTADANKYREFVIKTGIKDYSAQREILALKSGKNRKAI